MSPPPINYDGRVFRVVENSDGDDVDDSTRFHYYQLGDIVWATYEGDSILIGMLAAAVDPDGSLDMRYAHVRDDGKLMTGRCRSTPELMDDGRLRLHERWTWAGGGTGVSLLEEVWDGEMERDEPRAAGLS